MFSFITWQTIKIRMEWGKFLLLVETEVADMEFIDVILVIGGKIPN